MASGDLADLATARRVLCAGVTGSGKSTIAAQLAVLLDLPVIPSDEIGWRAGWVKRDPAETEREMRARLAEKRWIADSVWRDQLPVALARADVVIGLDYAPTVTWWRLVRRTARRVRRREPLWHGDVETLARTLSRDSILLWHRASWRAARDRIRSWESDAAAPPVIRLRRPRDAERLLAELRVQRS